MIRIRTYQLGTIDYLRAVAFSMDPHNNVHLMDKDGHDIAVHPYGTWIAVEVAPKK